MRKFAPMLMILPTLLLSIILAGEDGIVAWAALVISASVFIWNIWIQWKSTKPTVRLVIRNVDNRHFPEMGPPRINILCLRLSFGSDFISFRDMPEIRDSKGKSLNWSPIDPEDWNGSFDKHESPVGIYFDFLVLEQNSHSIRAVCRFDNKVFRSRSNKLRCDNLLDWRVEGVRRKKQGEKESEPLF